MLFFLLMSFCAQSIRAAVADPGDRIDAMLNYLSVVSTDNYVEIKSDAALKNVGELARQFADAYNFDRHLLGLDTNSALSKRFTVGLATEGTICQFMKSTMGGRAIGTDSFVSHANFYSERPYFAWFVTSHELEHLQMHRLHANEPDVPVYIFEGIACSVGDRYVLSKYGNCNYLRNATRKLAASPGADAAYVIQNFRDSNSIVRFKAENRLWEGEHIGGLFIEFLQSRFGAAKFFHLFGQICEDMHSGSHFNDSFQRRVGMSLQTAEDQFISHMTKTESNPDTRFAGTVYQGL